MSTDVRHSDLTVLKSILRRRGRIALPQPFQSFGQGLLFHAAVAVPGVAGKNKLVMIALGGQHLGHVLVGEDPIVHVVAHDIRIEKVPVADFHPDSQRLGRAVGDQVFMKFPRAVRGLGVRTATAGSRRCPNKSARGGKGRDDTTP